MRARCGCQELRRLGAEPPAGEGAAEAWGVERDAALADAAAWQCPAAPAVAASLGAELPKASPEGKRDPELVRLARLTERVIGAEVGSFDSCPHAELIEAPEWVAELTTAVSLAVDWNVPMSEVLGRELTAADVQGLDALKRAQSACWRRDQAIERQRREIEAAKRAAQGRP